MNPNPKDAFFYSSANDFVRAASEVALGTLKTGFRLPTYTIQRHVVHGCGNCRTEYTTISSPIDLISPLTEKLQALPQYAECKKAMENNPQIAMHLAQSVGFWNCRGGINTWDCLTKLLEKQVTRFYNKQEYSQTVFNQTYFDLEDFFFNDFVPTIAFSPLQNFYSDVEQIELCDNLRIRKLSNEELGSLIDELCSFHASVFELSMIQYVIECEYPTKKIFGRIAIDKPPTPDIDVSEKINRLTTALRLFKPGRIGTTIVKERYLKETPLNFGGTTRGLFQNLYWGLPYQLKGSEVEEFRTFWSTFNITNTQTIALSRFNYTYDRSLAEDRLIDMLIAFEALFLKGQKSGPASKYIIAIACSLLIGKTNPERKKIEETLSKAYEMRNLIVHGSHFERVKTKNGAKIDTLAEITCEIEDYLRQSIKRMLN